MEKYIGERGGGGIMSDGIGRKIMKGKICKKKEERGKIKGKLKLIG